MYQKEKPSHCLDGDPVHLHAPTVAPKLSAVQPSPPGHSVCSWPGDNTALLLSEASKAKNCPSDTALEDCCLSFSESWISPNKGISFTTAEILRFELHTCFLAISV